MDEITTVTMTALHEAPTINELPNTISISSLQVYHESVTDNSHVESTVLEGEIYDNDAQSTVSQLFIDDIQPRRKLTLQLKIISISTKSEWTRLMQT